MQIDMSDDNINYSAWGNQLQITFPTSHPSFIDIFYYNMV